MGKREILPFQYGKTVSKTYFTNRTAELKKLSENLMHGINTIIISPRRWGKSSLVEKAMSRVSSKNKEYKIVMIDLFSVGSIEDFLEIYAREVIKASSSKLDDWLNVTKTFFKALVPKISLQPDPQTEFGISFDFDELHKHTDEVLNLPELIAKKKKFKFIICLDEFQYLAELKGYKKFERKMRAAWQKQKRVSYCMYGSKRHMMDQLFNSSRSPFYRFGDIMFLEKIHEKEWIKFISSKFKKTGKSISADAVRLIPQYMANHSWYVQQLSHYVWESCGQMATASDVEYALERLIRTNTPLYMMSVEQLSFTQLNLLKAIAKEESKLTSKRVMRTFEIGTPQNVIKNRRILIKKDIIQSMGGMYEFADPAFLIWFKQTYFGN